MHQIRGLLWILVGLCLSSGVRAREAQSVRLESIGLSADERGAVLTLSLSGPVTQHVFRLHNPERLVIDLPATQRRARLLGSEMLLAAPSPPVAALLRERHEALRETIASSVAALPPDEQMASRGLLVWATLTWRQSVRAQRALPNVILPRRYDALADGWQAWRGARRAAAGKLRLD